MAVAHVFVGGDMERLDTAAYDVIFFLHHAFVDYIWEMFRDKVSGFEIMVCFLTEFKTSSSCTQLTFAVSYDALIPISIYKINRMTTSY